MRLNALSASICGCILIVVASVAAAIAADSRPPKRGLFNFRARPLEPTPARRPVPNEEDETVPPAAGQSALSRQRATDRTGPIGGTSTALQGILSHPIGTPLSGPTAPTGSAASRRLLGIQDATADPDLDRVPFQTSPEASSLPAGSAAAAPEGQPAEAPAHRIATRPIPNHPATTALPRSEADAAESSAPTTELAAEPQSSAEAAARKPVADVGSTRDPLLSSSGPMITVAASGPRKIVIGKLAAYGVVVTNRGNAVAHDVTISINLPEWIELSSSQSSVGATGIETDVQQNSVLKWKIRQLPPRSAERLDLKVIPRDSRSIDLAVRWTYAPSEAVAQIEVQEPKLQMSVTGPEDVLFGETKVYTITVSNPGTGDAENVVLNLLPVTPDAEAAGARDIGTLPAGASKSIDVELTAHQAGRLQIRSHAFADGGLRAEASQDVIVRRAILQVAAIGPSMKYSGTTASYKIRVANTGDATAREVLLAAVLPAGANYVGSTDGGQFDAQQGQVTWQIGSLRHGAVRIFDLQCTLTSPGENRLDVRSRGAGDLAASRTVVTSVEALADLKLSINDPKGAVPVGSDSEYEVRIVNRGTKAAEEIRVVGFFGPNVEPVSIQGWRGDVSTGQVEFEPIGRLNAGQELVFKIVARADAPGTHRFRVEVTCTDPDTKLASEESTKFYGDSRPTLRQAATAEALGPEPPPEIVR
jgi:uncharacterized repeat protein (TIGR01451 family)